MNILCIICQDLITSSEKEDIVFAHCGHVFHHPCLTQWLERSDTCPQCRTRQMTIHKAHFATLNKDSDTIADNTDCLQERVDSLKFRVLLREKTIKHYISKNATLMKQNAGLRQEIRKIESEIKQKNSSISALKAEMRRCFKEKCRKNQPGEMEAEDLQHIHQSLSMDTIEDVQKMIEKETDPKMFIHYVLFMKEIVLEIRRELRIIQSGYSGNLNSPMEERAKRLECETRYAFCESANSFLRRRVKELEKLLTLAQNSVTESNNKKNSKENSLIDVQTIDTQQKDTKKESANQNRASSSKMNIENITDENQGNSMHNSTFDERPNFELKRARLLFSTLSDSSDNSGDEPFLASTL